MHYGCLRLAGYALREQQGKLPLLVIGIDDRREHEVAVANQLRRSTAV